MTTTTDPGGAHHVTYNHSGTTIDTLVGGVSPSQADAVPIVRYAGVTVVVVTSPNTRTDCAVSLPADARNGDVVEVYGDYTTSLGRVSPTVYPEAGGSIGNRPSFGLSAPSAVYRKVSETNWAVVASAPF